MHRDDSDESDCGLDTSRPWWWEALILYHLRPGPIRFSDLKRLVAGIGEKVLIQQLRETRGGGMLVRRDYPAGSAQG